MKQIEITVRLIENKNEAIKKIEKLGYKKIRESDIYDTYLSQKTDELNKNNIQYVLKKSILLRNLKVDGNNINKITYKNKEFDNER